MYAMLYMYTMCSCVINLNFPGQIWEKLVAAVSGLVIGAVF